MRIYLFDEPEKITGGLYERLLAMLPGHRRQKALRYKNISDSVLCAVSYKLLGYGLFEEYGIESFSTAVKDNGKPYLADVPGVFFNISHCLEGCICALSDSEVGADIQHPVRLRNNVIKRVCTQQETELINSSADPELTFRGIWCMKEAYLKMLGTGIAADMKTADTSAEGFPGAYLHFDRYSLAACEQKGLSTAELKESIVHLGVNDIV